jgi:hypothetical protein
VRRIILVALASSTFGGAVGALATAATQSQASAGAIAAAVQKVQDQKADRTLATISNKLGTLDTDLNPTKGELLQLAEGLSTQFGKVDNSLTTVNSTVATLTQHLEYPGEFGGALNANAENLWALCEDTPGDNSFRCAAP